MSPHKNMRGKKKEKGNASKDLNPRPTLTLPIKKCMIMLKWLECVIYTA